jgi:DNA-directed RNA polymerase III subunit RPC6
MPPRKRPAPPPERPSPASKLHTEVTVKEPPSDDSEPRISNEILTLLPVPERKVYELIFAAGGKGMWMLDVRNATGMAPPTASKILRSLVTKQLLKEVSDVRHRGKKIFMATDFQPSTEITGGTWYHDGRLDTDAVAAARRSCLAQVQKLGVATADMIHHGIEKSEHSAGYAIDKIRDILQTMVLDKVLEEVKSTGEGEFAAIRSGRLCYRVAAPAQGGTMEGIPCGVCPRIDECSPDGVISPNTCVYFDKWLHMDF